MKKKIRKYIRAFKWAVKRSKLALAICAIVMVGGGLAYTNYIQDKRITADPKTYAALLNLIAHAESNGNYNAYFGNASNTSIDFTRMTIAEVMTWQADYVASGHASSAVGRYQIIDTTLASLVRQLHIDTQQRFDAATQDQLAMSLLERRGATAYVNQEISPEEFAANLAKEWAGLPKVVGENPGDSYYASDGLNKSRVEVAAVMKAIEPIRPL